jgi:hypothetical protein
VIILYRGKQKEKDQRSILNNQMLKNEIEKNQIEKEHKKIEVNLC